MKDEDANKHGVLKANKHFRKQQKVVQNCQLSIIKMHIKHVAL